MWLRRSVALGITPTWIRLESLSDEVSKKLLSFRSTHSHASPPPAFGPAAGRCIVVSVLFLTVSGSQGSPPPRGPGARPCGAESIYTPLPRPAQGGAGGLHRPYTNGAGRHAGRGVSARLSHNICACAVDSLSRARRRQTRARPILISS
jgi:hypothetical protein